MPGPGGQPPGEAVHPLRRPPGRAAPLGAEAAGPLALDVAEGGLQRREGVRPVPVPLRTPDRAQGGRKHAVLSAWGAGKCRREDSGWGDPSAETENFRLLWIVGDPLRTYAGIETRRACDNHSHDTAPQTVGSLGSIGPKKNPNRSNRWRLVPRAPGGGRSPTCCR